MMTNFPNFPPFSSGGASSSSSFRSLNDSIRLPEIPPFFETAQHEWNLTVTATDDLAFQMIEKRKTLHEVAEEAQLYFFPEKFQRPRVNTNAFANLFLDKVLRRKAGEKKGDLEGSHISDILPIVLTYLKQIQKDERILRSASTELNLTNLIEILELIDVYNYLSFNTNFESLLDAIRQRLRDVGKVWIPITIPGQNENHQIIIGIIKNTNDPTYAIEIYNTGSGINIHEQVYFSVKKKICPLFVVVGVSEEVIFESYFLLGLLTSQNRNSKSVDENCENFYASTVINSGGKVIPGSDYQAQFDGPFELIDPQESGTCVAQVLYAFIQLQLKDRRIYSLFKHRLGLDVLNCMINSGHCDPKLIESARMLKIKEAARNYKDGFLSEQEYVFTIAILENYKNKIFNYNINNSFIRRKHPSNSNDLIIPSLFSKFVTSKNRFWLTTSIEKVDSILEMLKDAKLKLPAIPWFSHDEEIGISSESSWKTVENIQKLRQAESGPGEFFFRKLLDTLPALSSPLWDEVPISQIDELTQMLFQIAISSRKAGLISGLIYSEYLYAIADRITRRHLIDLYPDMRQFLNEYHFGGASFFTKMKKNQSIIERLPAISNFANYRRIMELYNYYQRFIDSDVNKNIFKLDQNKFVFDEHKLTQNGLFKLFVHMIDAKQIHEEKIVQLIIEHINTKDTKYAPASFFNLLGFHSIRSTSYLRSIGSSDNPNEFSLMPNDPKIQDDIVLDQIQYWILLNFKSELKKLYSSSLERLENGYVDENKSLISDYQSRENISSSTINFRSEYHFVRHLKTMKFDAAVEFICKYQHEPFLINNWSLIKHLLFTYNPHANLNVIHAEFCLILREQNSETRSTFFASLKKLNSILHNILINKFSSLSTLDEKFEILESINVFLIHDNDFIVEMYHNVKKLIELTHEHRNNFSEFQTSLYILKRWLANIRKKDSSLPEIETDWASTTLSPFRIEFSDHFKRVFGDVKITQMEVKRNEECYSSKDHMFIAQDYKHLSVANHTLKNTLISLFPNSKVILDRYLNNPKGYLTSENGLFICDTSRAKLIISQYIQYLESYVVLYKTNERKKAASIFIFNDKTGILINLEPKPHAILLNTGEELLTVDSAQSYLNNHDFLSVNSDNRKILLTINRSDRTLSHAYHEDMNLLFQYDTQNGLFNCTQFEGYYLIPSRFTSEDCKKHLTLKNAKNEQLLIMQIDDNNYTIYSVDTNGFPFGCNIKENLRLLKYLALPNSDDLYALQLIRSCETNEPLTDEEISLIESFLFPFKKESPIKTALKTELLYILNQNDQLINDVNGFGATLIIDYFHCNRQIPTEFRLSEKKIRSIIHWINLDASIYWNWEWILQNINNKTLDSNSPPLIHEIEAEEDFYIDLDDENIENCIDMITEEKDHFSRTGLTYESFPNNYYPFDFTLINQSVQYGKFHLSKLRYYTVCALLTYRKHPYSEFNSFRSSELLLILVFLEEEYGHLNAYRQYLTSEDPENSSHPNDKSILLDFIYENKSHLILSIKKILDKLNEPIWLNPSDRKFDFQRKFQTTLSHQLNSNTRPETLQEYSSYITQKVTSYKPATTLSLSSFLTVLREFKSQKIDEIDNILYFYFETIQNNRIETNTLSILEDLNACNHNLSAKLLLSKLIEHYKIATTVESKSFKWRQVSDLMSFESDLTRLHSAYADQIKAEQTFLLEFLNGKSLTHESFAQNELFNHLKTLGLERVHQYQFSIDEFSKTIYNRKYQSDSELDLYLRLYQYEIVVHLHQAISKNLNSIKEIRSITSQEAINLKFADIAEGLDNIIQFLNIFNLAHFSSKNNIQLRKNQINLYKNIYESIFVKNTSMISVQAPSGTGKSDILTPLFVTEQTLAQRKRMIIIGPDALHETTTHKLKSILQKTIIAQLSTFSFRRHYPTPDGNLIRLERLHKKINWKNSFQSKLQRPIKSRKIDFQSLLLYYFENLIRMADINQNSRECFPSNLIPIENTLIHLKRDSSLLCDEVHDLFDSKITLNYDYGPTQPVDKMIWKTGLLLLKSILKLNLRYDQFERTFDENSYNTHIRDPIIHDMISDLQIRMGNYYSKEAIIFWLKHDPDAESGQIEKNFKEFLSKLSKSSKKYFLLLRAYLHVYLPHSLKAKFFAQYGPISSSQFAVPYRGNNEPSTAQFAQCEIKVLLTSLMLLKNGISIEQLKLLVRTLKKCNRNLSTSSSSTDPYQQLLNAFDPPLETIDESDDSAFTEIHGKLKTNPTLIMAYLEYCLFPNLEQTTERLTANSQDVALVMFNEVVGLAATLNNHIYYPVGMEIQFDPMTDAEVSSQLLNPRICSVRPFQRRNWLETILDPSTLALADPCDILKGISNDHIAKTILQYRKDLQGVVIFDDSTKKAVILYDNGIKGIYTTSIHNNLNLFVYYDGPHCTGSDFPLPLRSEIAVLVDNDISWTTYAQTVKRARNLGETGQKAKIFVTEECQSLLEMQYPHPQINASLFHLSIVNEGKSIESGLHPALSQMIIALFRRELVNRLLNPKTTLIQKYQLITKHIDLLREKCNLDEYKKAGMVKKPISLAEKIKKMIEKYSLTHEDLVAPIQNQLIEIQSRANYYLSKTTDRPSGEMLNRAVETETQTQHQRNTLVELEQAILKPFGFNPFNPAPLVSALETSADLDFTEMSFQKLNQIIPDIGFDDSLFASKNWMNTIEPAENQFFGLSESQSDTEETVKLKRNYPYKFLKNIEYILEIKTEQSDRMWVLISTVEADILRDYLKRRSSEDNKRIPHLIIRKPSGEIHTSINGKNEEDEKYHLVMMQIAFLGAADHLDTKFIEPFSNWVNSDLSAKKKKEKLFKTIRKNRVWGRSLVAYENTQIYRLFNTQQYATSSSDSLTASHRDGKRTLRSDGVNPKETKLQRHR